MIPATSVREVSNPEPGKVYEVAVRFPFAEEELDQDQRQ